jgi:hypothetical protein
VATERLLGGDAVRVGDRTAGRLEATVLAARVVALDEWDVLRLVVVENEDEVVPIVN